MHMIPGWIKRSRPISIDLLYTKQTQNHLKQLELLPEFQVFTWIWASEVSNSKMLDETQSFTVLGGGHS